jgi:hypothetical protein
MCFVVIMLLSVAEEEVEAAGHSITEMMDTNKVEIPLTEAWMFKY